jgi:hypothetical protein
MLDSCPAFVKTLAKQAFTGIADFSGIWVEPPEAPQGSEGPKAQVSLGFFCYSNQYLACVVILSKAKNPDIIRIILATYRLNTGILHSVQDDRE